MFKGKYVFIVWGLCGLELICSVDLFVIVVVCKVLYVVVGYSEGLCSLEVFIVNQLVVVIIVYWLLIEVCLGDFIFFLCDLQVVVDWLIIVLEVQGEG